MYITSFNFSVGLKPIGLKWIDCQEFPAASCPGGACQHQMLQPPFECQHSWSFPGKSGRPQHGCPESEWLQGCCIEVYKRMNQGQTKPDMSKGKLQAAANESHGRQWEVVQQGSQHALALKSILPKLCKGEAVLCVIKQLQQIELAVLLLSGIFTATDTDS